MSERPLELVWYLCVLTLIQIFWASDTLEKTQRRQSAADEMIDRSNGSAIGLAPGFSLLQQRITRFES